jgi:hypothetical protein
MYSCNSGISDLGSNVSLGFSNSEAVITDLCQYPTRIPNNADQYITVKEDDPETLKSLPSYDDAIASNMPPHMLPKCLLSPVHPPSDDTDLLSFVLQIQINFIPGGLLLVLQISHAVVDGSGFALVMEELARNISASVERDRDLRVDVGLKMEMEVEVYLDLQADKTTSEFEGKF